MSVIRKANRPHALKCDSCGLELMRGRKSAAELVAEAERRGWDLLTMRSGGRHDACPQCVREARDCAVDPLTMNGPKD